MIFAFTDILETNAITTPVVTKKYSLFKTKSKFEFLTIRAPSLIAYWRTYLHTIIARNID